MEFTLTFIRIFLMGLYLVAPLVLSFCLFIIVLGQIAGHIEGWSKFDSLYWSFITAFTVGYGDIRPSKRWSKKLAILIAIVGIMFTGILVALTVHSASKAFEYHVAVQTTMEDKATLKSK